MYGRRVRGNAQAADVRLRPQCATARSVIQAGAVRLFTVGGALGERRPVKLRTEQNHAAGKGNYGNRPRFRSMWIVFTGLFDRGTLFAITV